MLIRARALLSSWIPPLAAMAAIFFFSAQSTVPSPLQELLTLLKDKTLHGLEYLALAALYVRGTRRQFPRACPLRVAVFSALAAACYGLTDEWHQIYVPGRTADLSDFLADCVGACLLAALFLYYHKRRYGYFHGGPYHPAGQAE